MNVPDAERQFHNKEAERLIADFHRNPALLLVKDPYEHLAGSTSAFDEFQRLLGPIHGRTMLDYGCGTGWLSVWLAHRGAKQIEAFDLSDGMVRIAQMRARINGYADRIHMRCADGAALPYPEGMFDGVVGISVLHHVDIDKSAAQLVRVLRPGGVAVFIEPLGENIFLQLVRDIALRRLLGTRTSDEHPLRYTDIIKMRRYFDEVLVREHQILGAMERIVGRKIAASLHLDDIDRTLMNIIPGMRRWARIVVIRMRWEE